MRLQTPGVIALTAAMALFAGCASTPLDGSSGSRAAVETRALSTGAATAAASQSRVATVDLAAGSSGAAVAAGTALLAAPRERIVFFDFDSFVIKDEFRGLLDAHARVLAADRGRHMTIEGHTDERGGREYNLALGQKRAEAVLRSLALLGVAESQLEAVSLGEERPLVQGSDESAWSRNRRAELKDR